MYRSEEGSILLVPFLLLSLLFLFAFTSDVAAPSANEEEAPLGYISSCEIDLNNDGSTDIVLFVESISGRDLIALLKTKSGYDKYIVAKNIDNMFLRCRFGKTVTCSKAICENNIIYTTPGAFIELKQSEGASVVYFWNGHGFTEVWTSD